MDTTIEYIDKNLLLTFSIFTGFFRKMRSIFLLPTSVLSTLFGCTVVVLSLFLGGCPTETMAFTTTTTTPMLFTNNVKQQRRQTMGHTTWLLSMSATTDTSSTVIEDTTTTNKYSLIKRDRYVATNRFTIRKGKEAKFEQRWATRKSRLATLEGFKYFHLMRRVKLSNDDSKDKEEDISNNYVSFTVWSDKKHFTSWRKGEAFKEAHGGTSIGAFVSTLLNSALLLKEPPRPAFYDGILTQSTKPTSIPPTTPDGWRAAVESNGIDLLPAECFVACNQFYIPDENREAFEKRWAERNSKLNEYDGFQAFTMLRRDRSQKGHGTVEMKDTEPTYVSTTIWRDRDSFNAWRTSQSFKDVHQQQAGSSQPSSESTASQSSSAKTPLWVKPPAPIFYEGTLVITQSDGL